jgi:RHS repeat-associated protein
VARTSPAPNIPPIPGMCPGVAVLGGGGGAGGGAGKGSKKGKGKKKGKKNKKKTNASGDGKNGGESCGDPVCPITGRMMLDLYDFGYNAPLQLKWLRTYSSRSSNEDSDLGFGWAHPFGWRIQTSRRRVAVLDENGKRQIFRDVTADEWDINDLGWQLRMGGESFELWLPDGRRLAFGGKVGGFHHLIGVSDQNGNAITITRDAYGRIESMIDSAGRAYRFEQLNGRIGAIHVAIEPTNKQFMEVARYSYDSSGNLTSFTDAEGFRWEYAYDGHLLIEHRLPTGLSYCYRYDGRTHEAWCVESWGEYIGKIDPALETPIPPRPAGEDTRTIKGIHHVKFIYLKDLHYSEVTNALGGTLRYYGDESGRVIKRVDEQGGVTEYYYDEQTGALIRETQPDGTEREAPDGDRDPSVSQASDGSKILQFDEDDGTEVVFDTSTGAVTTRLYDAHGNLTYVKHADGTSEQYEYDRRGLVLSSIDRAGVLTQFKYDAQGNEIEVGRPGAVELKEYDYLGRMTAHVDERGQRTEWVWDRRSEVIEKRLADGTSMRWDRNAMRMATRLENDGRITRIEYGGLDWPIRVEEPDGAVWQYRYDAIGNVVTALNPLGQVAQQRFDLANRQTGFTSFEGWSHEAGYDPAGRIVWKDTPVGRQNFAFDELGRLIAVEHPDGQTVAVEYDEDGRTIRFDNGVMVEREKSRVGNVAREAQGEHELRVHWVGPYPDAFVSDTGVPLLRTRDKNGEISLIEIGDVAAIRFEGDLIELGDQLVLRKSYDAVGQLTAQCLSRHDRSLPREQLATRSDPNVLWWATYDWRGTRLTGERLSDGRSIQYDLDAADRVRTRRVYQNGSLVEEENLSYDAAGTVRMARARYDALGRPSEIDGQSLEYDVAGRLIARNDGEITYEWSADGELLAVNQPDQSVRFVYDAYGRRTGKRIVRQNEVVRDISYVWTNNCVLYETDHTASRSRTYVRGDDSFAPYAHVDLLGSNPEIVYYLCSPNGFPVLGVDQDGREVYRADPTTFGEARSTGATSIDVRFANQHADEDVGLVYNYRRWYDPQLGVFISPDPELLEGNLAPRQYVDNPIIECDPSGLARKKKPDMSPTGTGLLKPGPWATKGTDEVPGFIDAGSNAKNHNFSDSTKRAIDNAGFTHGCHSCGSKDPDPEGKQPKLKHFVPDHQPPVSSIKHMSKKKLKGGVRLYPHCRRCSNKQSKQAKNAKANGSHKARGEAQVAKQKKQQDAGTGAKDKPTNAELKAESKDIKATGIKRDGKTGQKPKNGWPKGF